MGGVPVRRRHATASAAAAGRARGTANGEGSVDCWSCAQPDETYVWTNERWRLLPAKPNGLPVVVLLETREHHAEPGDLPDDLAAELGVMIARVERAVRSVGEIGRVHVCRWGDGSEHLHWWFMARPGRIPQLIGSFAAIWEDILPVTPDDVWQANLGKVVAALSWSGRMDPEIVDPSSGLEHARRIPPKVVPYRRGQGGWR